MRRLALLLALGALAGCATPTGTLVVEGTDPPDDIADFASLRVEVSGFLLHRSDGPEAAIAAQQTRINLTELQGGNVTTLARHEVPAGNYTWIRISVAGAVGQLRDGENVTVEVPSEKLMLNHPFEVGSGRTTTLLIELNVVRQGNDRYQLSPVIGSVR